jgi:tRNA U34 5-carboxymethylaminomethyl modifying enzyme MnmG/GidA
MNAQAQAQQASNALKQVNPQDLSKTFENALHLFQGKHDKLPELLADAGSMLIQNARKLSRTQVILAVGVMAVGAILVGLQLANEGETQDAHYE